MTQSITTIWRDAIHHVSDRLLTDDRSGQTFDSRSNKTIVVAAPRLAGVVAYAGVARIGKTATDEWLANTLAGAIGSPGPTGRGVRTANVGDLAARIQSALDGLPRRHLYGELQVHFAGLMQNRRGTTRPFAFTYTAVPGSATCVRRSVSDGVAWRTTGLVVATPALGDAEQVRLDADCADLTASADLRERFAPQRAAMSRAAERPGVGDHTLEVLIAAQPTHNIELRYLTPPEGGDVVDVNGAQVPAGYTPWLVTAWGVTKPKVMTPWDCYIGGSPLWLRVVGPKYVPGGESGVLAAAFVLPHDRTRTRRTGPRTIAGPSTNKPEPVQTAEDCLRRALAAADLRALDSPRTAFDGTWIGAVVDRIPPGGERFGGADRVAAIVGARGVRRALLTTPAADCLLVGAWTDDEARQLGTLLVRDYARRKSLEARLASRSA